MMRGHVKRHPVADRWMLISLRKFYKKKDQHETVLRKENKVPEKLLLLLLE